MKSRMQRGAALVVSLIMLVLITLMVITALNLGSSNFKAVSNSQFRDEAVAAANVAIEDRLSSNFDQVADSDGNLPTTTHAVDLDNDGPDERDYTVSVTPRCISASRDLPGEASSVELPPDLTIPSTWNTVWDIRSQVTNNDTGASIVIRSGARVLLNENARNSACPD